MKCLIWRVSVVSGYEEAEYLEMQSGQKIMNINPKVFKNTEIEVILLT